MYVWLCQAYEIAFSFSSVMVNQNHRHGVVKHLLSYAFSIRRMQMEISFVALNTLMFRLRSMSFRNRSSFQDLSSDISIFVEKIHGTLNAVAFN